MKKINPKLIAVGLTSVVVLLLILAGPVQAFVLGLSVDDTQILVGDSLIFLAQANLEVGESAEVNAFVLDLSGPVSISCTFFPNATKITSCIGMNIEKIEDYNYGYNYNLEDLYYNITLNTENYPTGLYQTELVAIKEDEVIHIQGPEITVSDKEVFLEKCSVRSNNGEMVLLGDNFGENNKMNFNIPKATAVKGSGSLTAQYEGTRFSYSYDIKDILSSDKGVSTILVNGEYKVQRGDKVVEEATIYLNKNEKSVNIIGSDFSVNYMDVNFIEGC